MTELFRGRTRRWVSPLRVTVWGLALLGSWYVLRSVGALFLHQPPTLAGVSEVLRYGHLTSVAPRRDLPDTKNQMHELARRYGREGLLDKAAELYRHLLKWTPDDFAYNLEFGELFLRKGDFAFAETYVSRALRLKPEDFYANVFMARIAFGRKQVERAFVYASAAHGRVDRPEKSRELSQLYRAIGEHYLSQQRYKDAIELFRRADLDERNGEIQFMLAFCWYQKGHRRLWFDDKDAMAKCREHLDRCLALDPTHERARRLRSRL